MREKGQILPFEKKIPNTSRFSFLLDSFPLVGKYKLDFGTCFQRTEYGKRETVTLQGRNKLTKVKITSHESFGYCTVGKTLDLCASYSVVKPITLVSS